jgi:hypothetical protein
MERVNRSDKPITSVFPVKSQKCEFGAEPRCRLIATSAGNRLTRNDMCELIDVLTAHLFLGIVVDNGVELLAVVIHVQNEFLKRLHLGISGK